MLPSNNKKVRFTYSPLDKELKKRAKLIRKRSEKKYADVELDLTFGDHTILKIENKMKELGNFDKNREKK